MSGRIQQWLSTGTTPEVRYRLRLTEALTRSEFKLQYQDSRLGYAWSLLKPLTYFIVLYLVFDRMLKFGSTFQDFPLYLLIGLVLWIFFVNATTTAMNSIVARGPLLRRISFPPLIIPISTTLTAGVTFLISLVPIAVLVAWQGITPRPGWLLLIPLLAELYVFTLGFALVLAALYVAFRDLRQLWDVVSQLLFFLTPIVYPLTLIPSWGQKLMFVSPLAQIMQDVRYIILYDDRSNIITIRDVYNHQLLIVVPFVVVVVLLLVSLRYFTREQVWFAERV